MSNKWTKEDIAIAISMIEKYSTFQEIASVLSRTDKSVKLKLSKLGYFRNQFSKTNIECLVCQTIFTDYVNAKRQFCSQSCAATSTNKTHIKRRRIEKPRKESLHCLECKSILIGRIPKGKKYCSLKCQHSYQINQRISSGIYSPRSAKRFLMKKSAKCSVCSSAQWNGKPIPLDIDHINGNSTDNSISNLRLICPNCHAQTPTYKGRNKGNGRHSRKERYAHGKSY